jgi:chaperonin cofactor prefoldin
MWILHFLPESFSTLIVHTVLTLGIVGSLLSFFIFDRIAKFVPSIAGYELLFKLVSGFLLIVGIYCLGGLSAEKELHKKIEETQEKIRTLEAQGPVIQKQIETVYHTELKNIHHYHTKVKTEIQTVEKVINAACKITPEAVQILNDASVFPKKTDEVSK